MSARKPVITVDGPAGSGKSTTARELARRLGYRHLDSGALYRALTFALLEEEVPEEEWPELGPDDLEALEVRAEADAGGVRVFRRDRILREELRTEEVTEKVSHLSSIPSVRSWLLRRQREAGRGGGVVADGRDMGSVVFPDAELKVFLVADLDERARRRLKERGEEESTSALRAEGERLAERDRRDRERAVAPLKPAGDAVPVDTTKLSIDEQVGRIIELLEALTGSRGSA